VASAAGRVEGARGTGEQGGLGGKIDGVVAPVAGEAFHPARQKRMIRAPLLPGAAVVVTLPAEAGVADLLFD